MELNSILTVKADEALKALKQHEKRHFPFALANALNSTAFDVMSYYKGKMTTILDRPTPFTVNSMFVKKASKRDMSCVVGFKEWASKGTPAVKYLHHLETGGGRPAKASERRLRQRGILKPNQFLIPAKKFQDQYGNVRRGQMQKALSAMQSTGDRATASKRGQRNYNQYFVNSVSKQKHFGPHIYKRRGKRNMEIFAYVVDKVNYKPILQYEKLATRRAELTFPVYMKRSMEYALRTAR